MDRKLVPSRRRDRCLGWPLGAAPQPPDEPPDQEDHRWYLRAAVSRTTTMEVRPASGSYTVPDANGGAVVMCRAWAGALVGDLPRTCGLVVS
jgi:hypothetical protein